MTNSEAIAAKWAAFIADRPEFPGADKLRAAFLVGKITRLCDCGCNSFDMELPDNPRVSVLAKPGVAGAIFQMSFFTAQEAGTVEFIVFVDHRGHFSGIDVHYCGNAFAMPDNPHLIEPPVHVHVSNAIVA